MKFVKFYYFNELKINSSMMMRFKKIDEGEKKIKMCVMMIEYIKF